MWRIHKSTNSMKNPLVNPRVSLIAGIDTEGHLYLSLVQANTNNDVMRAFLQWLARRLDSERKNWRSNTIIQLDGASYHLCKETKGTLEQLGMSVIYSGP